jgi:hypothetical protein
MQATPRQVKLIRWLLFGVVLSLLPLIAAYLTAAAFAQVQRLSTFLSGGAPLLLISATLTGAAVGELFGHSGRRPAALEVFVGGLAIFVALLAAISYATFTTASTLGNHPNEGFVAIYSTVLFSISVASGAGCVALSER